MNKKQFLKLNIKNRKKYLTHFATLTKRLQFFNPRMSLILKHYKNFKSFIPCTDKVETVKNEMSINC